MTEKKRDWTRVRDKIGIGDKEQVCVEKSGTGQTWTGENERGLRQD